MTTTVQCDTCGDVAEGCLPGTVCGRDLSEERDEPTSTSICQGFYELITGWLLEQTYGRTEPPEGVLIQRDDEADIYEGDVEAALAYAAHIAGTAHGIFVDDEVLAPQSDLWVVHGGPGGLVKHTLAEALENDWYDSVDDS